MPSAEIKSEDKLETRVIVVPDSAVSGIHEEGVKVLKLRHPKTREGSCFLYDKSSKTLCELLSYDEEHRSWFIGEKVVKDGRMMIATPVNPLYLALPYLSGSERLVPLDQMLTDQEFPEAEDILLETLTETRLGLVSDTKGSRDLNVWKYNEEKTLTWLEGKVRALADMFEKSSEDTSGGASSSIYRAGAGDHGDYLRYALGVVQEYLDTGLSEKLESKLDLPKVETKSGNKRLSSLEVEEDENKPRKKAKLEGPTEDYSKSYKKTEVKEEAKGAKDKALAKSAKGTKSIMSFFGKK